VRTGGKVVGVQTEKVYEKKRVFKRGRTKGLCSALWPGGCQHLHVCDIDNKQQAKEGSVGSSGRPQEPS